MTDANYSPPSRIMPIILLSMCGCISLWFAGNAVLDDLRKSFGLQQETLGFISSAVQLGFITGTFLFARYGVADRFPARLVYFACALTGAGTNLLILPFAGDLPALVVLRFLTGIALAGIYPVGMKIAAGWYREGLGRVLGFLLAAFVVGTALPHLIKGLGYRMPWPTVLLSVSLLAAGGGILMLLIQDGPYLKQGGRLGGDLLRRIMRVSSVRRAAFGYFGHMWELYAFWVFLPVFLSAWLTRHGQVTNVHLASFWIIGAGSLGCVIGGLVSRRAGSGPVAFAMLAGSGLCCLLSPLIFTISLPLSVMVGFLFFWGFAVVGDSPQFSTLVAAAAPPELVGTSLTIVNCFGFLISIFSIELCNFLYLKIDPAYVFLFLVPGPALGLLALRNSLKEGRMLSPQESARE